MIEQQQKRKKIVASVNGMAERDDWMSDGCTCAYFFPARFYT